MKISVIYNRESKQVINLFGMPNQEKYGQAAIRRIINALKKGGHQVTSMEGDKNLISKLEEFMPQVVKGERPGMAFNLSYGIQGQARYTHVPGILEMVGVPYVGSGPLAHSLALDKVVAKMLFVQNGIPTPEFAVLKQPGFEMPALPFPLIVKPKNESVSFGIKIVNSEEELRAAADVIFQEFDQAVLAERYIEGREINIGLLGNGSSLETFAPAELSFGESGPKIYTMEDKKQKSGRQIKVICPAQLDETTTIRAQTIARDAFNTLGCYDCARVDMRMDENDNLYILEINSLPSLGEHGSYVAAAQAMGLDFSALINRLVEVSAARYFGTPEPAELKRKRSRSPKDTAFSFLTSNRDQLEKRVEEWTSISNRSNDPLGIKLAAETLDKNLKQAGLNPVPELSDQREVWSWQSPAGMQGGTLLITQLDVPVNARLGVEPFQRSPEWLSGEGVGSSGAPLSMLEYTIRALKQSRRLNHLRIGALAYADEGRDGVESAQIITKASEQVKRVLVLNPGNLGDFVITARRGQRRYRLTVAGKSLKLGQSGKAPIVMQVLYHKLAQIADLSDRKEKIAVAVVDIHSDSFPRRLPHQVRIIFQVSYPDMTKARKLEQAMRKILTGESLQWDLALLSDRPPMPKRQINITLLKKLQKIATEWDIPLATESSLWPSPAGLVPKTVPVLCGLGPVAENLHTSRETVSRISLAQRTLLLTQLLLHLEDK